MSHLTRRIKVKLPKAPSVQPFQTLSAVLLQAHLKQEETLAVTGRGSADHTQQIAQLTARPATPKKLDGRLVGRFIQGEAQSRDNECLFRRAGVQRFVQRYNAGLAM